MHSRSFHDHDRFHLPPPPVSLGVAVSQRVQALDILQCHHAVTVRQFDRLYGIPARVLSGLPRRTITVAPVHMRRSLMVDATFVALDADLLNQGHGELCHLVGTAALQVLLGIPLDHWRALPSWYAGTNRPDAEYDHPNGQGLVAVEYDSGTYKQSLVAQKLEAYRSQGYLHTVWGLASARRRAHLEELLENLPGDLAPNIVLSSWWEFERRNG